MNQDGRGRNRKANKAMGYKILFRIDLLLGNDGETDNEITAVARQRLACQWTAWKATFSAPSTPMAAHGTMDTKVTSDVFYAVGAEVL
jgi:hypothetical protein